MQKGENTARKECKEGKYYNKKEGKSIYKAMYAINCKEHKNRVTGA